MGQFRLDVSTSANKVLGIVIMFFNTGRHGEDIGIEDDIFRRKVQRLGQQPVGAAANLDFTRPGVGLAVLVKRHYHQGGAVAAYQERVMKKRRLPLFHGNRINDALSLNTLQPLLYYLPFGGVDHNRHARDIRLAGDQVQEAHHGVKHTLFHVDVDNLRAVLQATLP